MRQVVDEGTRCAPHADGRTVRRCANRLDELLRKFKAQSFQALANPTRIAIVDVLREGDVLDLLRRYSFTHLNETASMLGELDEDARPRT